MDSRDYYKKNEIFACYKGDDLLGIGNLGELAEKIGTNVRSLKYNLTDAYKRRIKRRGSTNSRKLIRLEDEDNG